MPHALPSPMFIVGSPRSGTSMLAAALRGVGYHGFGEGNFLLLLEPLFNAIDDHFATFGSSHPEVMMSRIDKQELRRDLVALCQRIVDRENPVPPWLDKTANAGMIAMIPALLEAWPSSHFVFARRRGIENVESRRHKFRDNDFEFHCMAWAASMAAWRAVRQALPALKCLEVEQRDMAREPDIVAAELAAFLGLPPHQRDNLAARFREDRPEQSAIGSAERVLSLDDIGWSQQERELFLLHCGPEMEAFGYTLDRSYRREPIGVRPVMCSGGL